VAFVLILVLSQLCLLWLSIFVGSGYSEAAEKQKRLIEASDRLINDPSCLAETVGNSVVPQAITARQLSNQTRLYCCDGCSYGIGVHHTGTVVRRLVFVGGGAAVLEVW